GMRDVMKAALKLRFTEAELPEDVLDVYWKTAWGTSHSVVMAGCAGDEIGRCFSEEWKGQHSPTVGLDLPDIPILTVRGAWFAVQHGDALLPIYHRAFEKAEGESDLFDAVSALLAMGVKWPSLRKPVRRIFTEMRCQRGLEKLRELYVKFAMK